MVHGARGVVGSSVEGKLSRNAGGGPVGRSFGEQLVCRGGQKGDWLGLLKDLGRLELLLERGTMDVGRGLELKAVVVQPEGSGEGIVEPIKLVRYARAHAKALACQLDQVQVSKGEGKVVPIHRGRA